MAASPKGVDVDMDSLNLDCLLRLIDELPGYRQLVENLRHGGEQTAVVLDAAKPYVVAALHAELNVPVLVITPRPEGAKQLHEQLQAWGSSPYQFPEPDSLPYEDLPSDPSTVQQRINALYRLSTGGSAPLVIASSHAVAWKTTVPGSFQSAVHTISRGMRVDVESTIRAWVDAGYEWEPMVEMPGSFSRRGGIIDIYPPSSDLPARIELFGDEVESIRLFDPVNQRSKKVVESVAIVSAREHASDGNIIDYLPKGALLILDLPDGIAHSLEELDAEADWVRNERIGRGELPPDAAVPYLTWEELSSRLQGVGSRLVLHSWQQVGEAPPLPFSSAPEYGGRLDAFIRDAKEMVGDKEKRIVIVSQQARRLAELLEEQDVIAPARERLDEPPVPGVAAIVQGSLARGWITDSTALLSDAEIFGFSKVMRRARGHPPRQAGSVSELSVGDYVVHVEHGIASFAGTAMMRVGDAEREFLVLEYAANDRLYVPGDQVDRVGRYVGTGASPPSLSRLGTQEWSRTKRRVKEAAAALAGELCELYAAREIVPGYAFSSDSTWQEEMEASFPYVETPDQARTVVEIKHDMEQAKPMDRLVCGDVGYGKTEVALRAAFKAVQEDVQVAVLVPTTVLAQQHFSTFSERLAAFPVNVAVLSRFRSAREQDEIIAGLKRGIVDIVIGTHRLLQRDVSFKNLGLVVIDEEQRFGVMHKEHLKRLRKEVDVLTLTATPIPRTLYMSLSGVRDMSTMETPPEERLPIKTTISEYDESLIREAILREIERGGQVFLVHNRISSIRRVASRVTDLVPEAEVAVAHGQMPEEQLEAVMLDFSEGHIDVLVATTIIESGLDIPNVNTLIVNDADKLGLAQLYQLRGRVGRGSNRAYACFLYSKGKQLTHQARRRLQTIFEAAELGAGFRIAMRDLEIRGAGNLLGAEQSGHIGAVGFDLYCRILQEAVEELREGGDERAPRREPPSIDLPLRAYIPEEYIEDLDMRLDIYQRLANLTALEQLDEMAEELEDRFGPLTQTVSHLLYIIKVKILAMNAGAGSISTGEGQIVVKMIPGQILDRGLLEEFKDVKVGKTQIRLDIGVLGEGWKEMLEELLRRLGTLHNRD
jgi:transcription-repair coupling factor (superfamily II helicase)